ncbi:MAG: transglutaminase family protein [Planctomycetes bacterium]|nr:transglutaminase family protein [Planctomycetota bacterium]
MTIRVALRHLTEYRYDRLVALGPQVIRLRPAPHCRTPIASYSLEILPARHFLNWQQDPFGNFLARLVIPDSTELFRVEVNLTADLTVINPFDFFIEDYAEDFPFAYPAELAKDLQPFLECQPCGPLFDNYLKSIDCRRRRTTAFLVDLNQRLWRDVRYVIRMQPGVQTARETLETSSGSCRDSAWLLVQLLRRLGLAARFVSGYLVQLKSDQKSLDGPSGPEHDFTDLHAWCEVYLPGAGWVGLDPTSGLFTGEGHLPLAATPAPSTAAPISGPLEQCESEFRFEMQVTRIHEDPRVTLPYSDRQWREIQDLGAAVDQRLHHDDVRLTMGGEPTFVSIDDMQGAEWTTAAVGSHKQQLSGQLLRRLRQRFAPGGLLHYGQGKWYPGEPLPRWAYSCLWRVDGQPIWTNPELLADPALSGGLDRERRASERGDVEHGDIEKAEEFLGDLADRLEVERRWMRPAYEDIWRTIEQERKMPVDVDPREFDPDDDEDRRRLASILERGATRPVGYVMPLTKAWWQAAPRWISGPWPLRSERLFLIPGDSPIGLRLPLDSLPVGGATEFRQQYPIDPFAERRPLPGYQEIRRRALDLQAEFRARSRRGSIATPEASITHQAQGGSRTPQPERRQKPPRDATDSADSFPSGDWIATALCVELRHGILHVFMPPLSRLEDYLELVGAVEAVAEQQRTPVVIEGYLPPADPRLRILKVTPDPGVIEVNVQPAADWQELCEITCGVYDDARQSRLGTEKFQLDGKHTGTGGGNHLVLGGPTAADSPFLRRPDLLRSLLAYWNNHPSLSYLFSSQFIGPTSQSPRVDEGRRDALYELEIACRQIPEPDGISVAPWLVDRVFRHLLVDLTGNTHRAEFCIDKLFSPDHANGRLGLVELRGFEMPPHARMSLTQQLLVRALVAWFWRQPYRQALIRWNTLLHDRWLLPGPLWTDLCEVLADLRKNDFPFADEWFRPHWEFRCPRIGEIEHDGVRLELRVALEPWYVLGEEPSGGGTTRYVDSSVERLQVALSGMLAPRYAVYCNGRRVPLQSAGEQRQWIGGVRYRAWQPPSCLHPTLAVHTPLTFDIVDLWQERSIGGCRFHVDHPGGLNPAVFPVNALEAECRRAARFVDHGHSGGPMSLRNESLPLETTWTLDLRTLDLRQTRS